MPGVGFSHVPGVDPTEESNKIHLWKGISETYCGDHSVDQEVSGMTQVDKAQIERWRENDQVCDACVESLADSYL